MNSHFRIFYAGYFVVFLIWVKKFIKIFPQTIDESVVERKSLPNVKVKIYLSLVVAVNKLRNLKNS